MSHFGNVMNQFNPIYNTNNIKINIDYNKIIINYLNYRKNKIHLYIGGDLIDCPY